MSAPDPSRSTGILDLVRALRPQQWTKNALLYAVTVAAICLLRR